MSCAINDSGISSPSQKSSCPEIQKMSLNSNSPQKIYETDAYLAPFAPDFQRREKKLQEKYEILNKSEILYSYKIYGLHEVSDNNFVCTEFLPGVKAVHLTGDFNDWNPTSHNFSKIANQADTWELKFTSKNLKTGSHLKLTILTENNMLIYRLCPWATFVTQPKSQDDNLYSWTWVNPNSPGNSYRFEHDHIWPNQHHKSLKIYEAHVGICTEKKGISSYSDFTEFILPKVKELGYNCIQLMAIMEHAYYGSFGYQVTNFYAISSRFGEMKALKKLIDTAHSLNISVLLDVVHSHASKNVLDGLNNLNGLENSNPVYFHKPPLGDHHQWGSKCFNYDDHETLRFLLSNLIFWVEEYKFDGFRFDGVTSMMYRLDQICRL